MCVRLPRCVERSLSYQRADAMYRRCLEVNPEHGYALYNLAVLKEERTKDGDYSEVMRSVVGGRFFGIC